MAAIIEQAGIHLSSAQIALLWRYHQLLRRYNQDLNLTRVHNFENMVTKLYIDSLLPGQLTPLPSPLLDIGTGPGMPGIPLAIAHPEKEIILAESRKNRVEFLERAMAELGLENVSVEGLGITPAFTRPVAGVITRAVETIDKTLPRINGCLRNGGAAVFMKGPKCDEEVSLAVQKFEGAYQLTENIFYRIPQTPHKRRLVIFQRLEAPLREKKESAMGRHRVRDIASEQNDTFKNLKRLLSGRGIRKQERALVSGTKQVEDVLTAFPERALAWITDETLPPPPDGAPSRMGWYRLSRPLFKTLDVNGTRFPLLLQSVPGMEKWRRQDGFAPGCSLLVPFQDPENVGAVIRSAVAFGVRRIILLSESANPYHPKAIRASGGAVFHAELFQGPSIKDLPTDLAVVSLSAEGEDIGRFFFPESFGLLPGAEGSGLPGGFRKNALAIPISGVVESLNAATAAGIALYLWSRSSAAG
jgi:16S rRNA (guanine527-N7)-methyltransferase